MKAPAVALLVALGFVLGLATGLGVGTRRPHEPELPTAPAASTQQTTTTQSTLEAPPPFERPPHAEPSSDARVEVVSDIPSARPTAQVRESGSITVTVVDSVGAPLADAAVRKRAERGERVVPVLEPEDIGRGRRLLTNAAGQVTLEDVPWGEYRVVAEREGLAPGLSEPVRLSLEAPEIRATVTLTIGGTVIGELRDVNGAPAAAIGLSIHPGRLRAGPSAVSLRQVNTDRNGAFAFEHLPAGTWNLYTRAVGADVMRVPEQRHSVEVFEGQTTRVQFKDLSGTAVRVSGQVLRNGEAMPKVRVIVSAAEPGTRLGTQVNAETDAQGRFQMLLQEPGDYRFGVAQLEAEVSTRTVSFLETIPKVAQHDVILAFETGSISGRVTLASGEPAHGADVMVLAAKSADPRRPSGGGSVSTNVEGRYSFTGLPAGRYRLQASAANRRQISFDGAASSEEVLLEPGGVLENVDIQMSAGGALEGRVLRGDGTPVAGARIELRGTRSGGSGTADQQGKFMLGGLMAGPGWLRAYSERECSNWIPVNIVANATASRDMVLAPGTVVLVEVVDSNGPAAQASVTFSAGNEKTIYTATVFEGKGREGPIPPGTYTVALRRSWRDKIPAWESSITLNGEAERVLQLRLP